MKSMRQLINLMEGVTAVPGIGPRPNSSTEADMQSSGTIGRDQAAGEFDAAQGPVTEKSTSEKQSRFMAAAAHNPEFAKKAGISQDVAKEFNRADKGTEQLSKAMKNKESVEMDEGFPQPMDHQTVARLNKEVADRKWANQRAEDEKERQLQKQKQEQLGTMKEGMEEHSEEVQQALADFENVVMNLGMPPEDAYDRICNRLSDDAVSEFRQALADIGAADELAADDTILIDNSDDKKWSERDYDSHAVEPPEDYNLKDYGSDTMEEALSTQGNGLWDSIRNKVNQRFGGNFDQEME